MLEKTFVLIALTLKIFIKRLSENLMSHRNLFAQHNFLYHRTLEDLTVVSIFVLYTTKLIT